MMIDFASVLCERLTLITPTPVLRERERLLKSLIARLRVKAFKYIVICNYGLCGSNYS